MNYLYSFALFATLFASNAAEKQIVPQGDCSFLEMAQCAAAFTKIVSDINGIPRPPSVADVKAVLLNGQVFLQQCESCLYEHQNTAICVAIDTVVKEAKVGVDFDFRKCLDEGIVEAVKDALEGIPGISMSEVIDRTAQALVSLGVSPSEARSIAMDNADILPTIPESAPVNAANLAPIPEHSPLGANLPPIPENSPILRNACVNVDFDFFKIVSHKGRLCASYHGIDSYVTVKGSFSALGNPFASYEERFDKNSEVCYSAFNGGVYKMSPCIRVDFQRKTLFTCVKQELYKCDISFPPKCSWTEDRLCHETYF